MAHRPRAMIPPGLPNGPGAWKDGEEVPWEEQERRKRRKSRLGAEMTFRTGIGVDIHSFAADGTLGLVLAGVEFPDQAALSGHSDGDIACHAAADALLSAAGLGDLGSNFDPRDPAWSDANGLALLTEASRRVREAGYEIANVARQIVGSRPKLAPVRSQAEANLTAAVAAPATLPGPTPDGPGSPGPAGGPAALATPPTPAS